jgi:hypothetical protein
MAVLAALAGAGGAEVIDRIAVSVGNRVITTAEIEREARLTAFLNGAAPDLSPEGRKKTAERLIEQRLVKRELEAANYPEPDRAGVEDGLREIKARHKTAAAYQEALARYAITDEDLREHLIWQQAFLRFIDVRFRPAAQVSEEDVREYFEKTVKPLADRANPGKPADIERYREQIEAKLTGERVDAELDRWLQAARRRNRVEYREGAFR